MNNDDITIDELLHMGKISIRTANVLKNFCETFDDVRRMAEQGKLYQLRGCGKKTLMEIKNLLSLEGPIVDKLQPQIPELFESDEQIESNHSLLIPSNIRSTVERIYHDTVSEFFGHNPEIYNDIYISIYDFLYDIYSKKVNIFIRKPEIGFDLTVKVWECTYTLLMRLEPVVRPYNHALANLIALCADIYTGQIDVQRYHIVREYLSPARKRILKSEFERRYATLSQRSRNALKNAAVDDVNIAYNIVSETFVRYPIRGCGRKSIEEIIDTFADYPQKIFEVKDMPEHEVNRLSLIEDFPFISEDEATFAIDFQERNGYFPNFFLISCYLRSECKSQVATISSARIFCSYYGIDCEPSDRQQLSDIYSLSPERIRQILVGYKPDSNFKAKIKGMDWSHYPEIHTNPRYCDANRLYERIADNELRNFKLNAPLSFAAIMLLIGDMQIVHRQAGLTFVVDNLVCRQFDFSRALIDAEALCGRRHDADDPIDIADCCRNYIKDDRLLGICSECFKEMVLSYLPIYEAEGQLFIKQNYIRPAREAYIIIKENGSPMTLENLYLAFKAKFPDHKFDNPECLRCHLSQANGFRAIGKQSTYSLDIWDFNTDSNTELIYKILSASDVPLHSSEIVRRLAALGRESNSMLVVNFIYMDRRRGFKRFRHSHFGIEGKDYPENFIPIKPEDVRVHSFEERLDDLIKFITTHHHRPRCSEDAAESSLYRWIENVNNRKVNLTPEQIQAFNDTIRRHAHDYVTASEHEFRSQCIRLTDYIRQNRELPAVETDRQLYRWLRRAVNDHGNGQLNEFRSACFNDLLAVIADYGLRI